MQQRKPAVAGRPSGTDGSDYSYRTVVDSRYTKVAKGKYRLRALILVQVAFYLVGSAFAFLTSKEDDRKTLAVSAAGIGALVQIFAIITTSSLVSNMSPPKKTS